MRFQNVPLPDRSSKLGETSWLTQDTVPNALLNKHMAPKGKVGLLLVKTGSCNFVWEDNLDDVFVIDKNNPFVIEPERFHHVIITNNVVFKIEFYKDSDANSFNEEALRSGEEFL